MLVKYANFVKIQPIAPDKRVRPKASNLQPSQSKWLGHFGVSLSPQCWCTRFGD